MKGLESWIQNVNNVGKSMTMVAPLGMIISMTLIMSKMNVLKWGSKRTRKHHDRTGPPVIIGWAHIESLDCSLGDLVVHNIYVYLSCFCAEGHYELRLGLRIGRIRLDWCSIHRLVWPDRVLFGVSWFCRVREHCHRRGREAQRCTIRQHKRRDNDAWGGMAMLDMASHEHDFALPLPSHIGGNGWHDKVRTSQTLSGQHGSERGVKYHGWSR